MNSNYTNVKPVPFSEHSALLSAQASDNTFDILIEGDFSVKAYCNSLIGKIFVIPQSEFPRFLNHHCGLVKEPFNWLNRFEKLLSVNEELFFKKKERSRFTKIFLLIENKRKETQKAEDDNTSLFKLGDNINGCSHNRIYSFVKTKAICDNSNTYEEKIFFLEGQITLYRQYPPYIVNHNMPHYIEQCQLEIDMLVRNDKFRRELALQNIPTPATIKKFPVNIETKSFVHVFYLLMQKNGDDGKPVLPYSVADVAEHICSHYCHMAGTPFKLNTVRTYLTKGKPDSRPKGSKEIDLDLDSI